MKFIGGCVGELAKITDFSKRHEDQETKSELEHDLRKAAAAFKQDLLKKDFLWYTLAVLGT